MEKQVFYCPPDKQVVVAEHGPVKCPVCNETMHNSGWFAYVDKPSSI